jgi:hypothetical protein
MRTITSNALVLLVALLLGGCGSRVASGDSGVSDAGPGSDAQLPTGPWAFIPEDNGSVSPAVALRPDPAGDVGALLVVARGVARLQGLAVRLRFDPKQVTMSKHEVGGSWYGSGKDLVSQMKARPEGELWAGIGYSGSFSLDAQSEVTLARLQVKLSGSTPAQLAFRAGRNLVIDPDGARVKVTWLGGTFVRAAK